MTIKTIIEMVTGETPLQTTPILTGLTNDNVHVTTQHFDVVLRIPKPENKDLFDYQHEAHILELIKPLNLEPPLLYFDPITGVKCATYIEDAHTLSPEHYCDAVKLLAKLHNANIQSGQEFNLEQKYTLYQAKKPLYDLSDYDHYITQAQPLKSNLRLCHNDCVEGNFLFTSTQHYLIDYEYALDNDPYFDLLSLITENDITDPKHRSDIIDTYFSLVDIPYDEIKFTIFEGALLALWCAWACSMYEIHQESIFKEIADLKYMRLTQLSPK